ncbi:unnamed protein product [Larinioides sclopetarius]|uniref:Secreted protein n=1 Tax=Larinioides sclopetarius TaxID=280406 RepID=A0AAV2B901_9ARAC
MNLAISCYLCVFYFIMCTATEEKRRTDFAVGRSATPPVLEIVKRPPVLHRRNKRRNLNNALTSAYRGCTPPPGTICCENYTYDLRTGFCHHEDFI